MTNCYRLDSAPRGGRWKASDKLFGECAVRSSLHLQNRSGRPKAGELASARLLYQRARSSHEPLSICSHFIAIGSVAVQAAEPIAPATTTN